MDWSQKITSFASLVDFELSEERVSEPRRLTEAAMKKNVVARKRLPTYIGKCFVFASIFVFWRPFLSELYEALSSLAQEPDAPHSCIWRRQIMPA